MIGADGTAIRVTLDLLPLGLGLVLIPLTIAAALAALGQRPLLAPDLLRKLGLGALPSGVAVALGLLWLLLFTAFTAGILWVIASLIWRGPAMTEAQAPDYRWHLLTLTALTASLAAVVALPFTLLRTGFAARQTRTAEENLTTDLINKAVEGLGAQKEVNQLGRTFAYSLGEQRQTVFETVDKRGAPPEGATEIDYQDWKNITLTVPNIEVRLGAIYALERIAQDSPRDHIRVMEILCAYLRENAPARDAQPNPLGPWPDYPENPTDDDLKAREKALEERRKALDLWISDLKEHHAPRADIQAAITVIGRRSPAQIALEQTPKANAPAYRLDLRKVTLQAADLSRLNLAAAQLDEALLEGAFLGSAHLEGAVLVGAHLERASLSEAHLEGASLGEAHLEGAFLGRAHLEAAVLVGAHLEGAHLGGAHLERAGLVGAHLERADLHEARLPLALISRARLARACLGKAHLERANFVEAHLEQVDLHGAHLGGAVLVRTHLSERTCFRPTTLRGASLHRVDLSTATTVEDELPRLLSEAFGDASVTLPNGLKAGEPPLEHWSTESLDWTDFIAAWRAHQRDIGYAPPD